MVWPWCATDRSHHWRRTPFRFDRDALDPIAGAQFAVGVVVTIGLTALTDLDLLVVLVSGLLAWLTDMPGTLRYRVTGMAAFGTTTGR